MNHWQRAENYWGETYYDYLVLLGQHRDSDALQRSNFQCALELLGGEGDGVLVARAGHWAVGWVESLLIHGDAKDKVAIGEEIEESLSRYPVLNDEHYSELESGEIMEYWEREPLRWRVELCQSAGVTAFAARHNDAPYTYSELYDYLRD